MTWLSEVPVLAMVMRMCVCQINLRMLKFLEWSMVNAIASITLGVPIVNCVLKTTMMSLGCQPLETRKMNAKVRHKNWRDLETIILISRKISECDCNEHSNQCVFNPSVYTASGNVSGGVCLNCEHFTEGKNCEACIIGYYQDPELEMTDPEICKRKFSLWHTL